MTALRWTLFVAALPLGLLSFMLPIYGYEIGASAAQIGLFLSVFSLVRVLLRPLVGVGVDRYGRKPFLLAGLAGYASSMFAFAFADQIWALVAARVLQGVGAACLWLAVNTLVADVSPEEGRGRDFGRTQQARVRGRMLGVLVGLNVLFSLGIDVGWRPLFIAFGVTGLGAVLLAWFGLPETRRAPVEDAPQSSRWGISWGIRWDICWSRAWIVLLLISFVTNLSWSLVSPTVTIFLQQRLGVETVDLAWAYLPAMVAMALFSGQLGLLADYYGRKPLMLLGIAVSAVGSFVIPSLTSLWGLAALRAVQALCHMASSPAQQALVADLVGSERRGQGYGFYALASGLGQVAGPAIGGWLYDAVSPAVPFYLNGVMLALCAIAVAIWLGQKS